MKMKPKVKEDALYDIKVSVLNKDSKLYHYTQEEDVKGKDLYYTLSKIAERISKQRYNRIENKIIDTENIVEIYTVEKK